MKELFRRTPLQQFTQYSASHMDAGTAYQVRFRDRPGRAAMWVLEQQLIKRIYKSIAPRNALDFATGTGRIVSVLEKFQPDCEFHGIDISNSMLTIARDASKRVIFHEMDGRQALNYFGEESFDVVSAFRFFSNAEPALRKDVAEQIAGLTKYNGRVILNNHRSFWSIPYVLMRAKGNSDGSYGACNDDIKRLFLNNGFACERSYSLGIWPQTETRSILLSWSTTSVVERFNMRYLSQRHRLGYNTIFVFKKIN